VNSDSIHPAIENGNANPALRTIPKIADALGIEATALFNLPPGESFQANELAENVGEIMMSKWPRS